MAVLPFLPEPLGGACGFCAWSAASFVAGWKARPIALPGGRLPTSSSSFSAGCMALSHDDPQLIEQVADTFEQLSSDAVAEISRQGFVDVPAAATLRAGDWQALQRLYGLIPVTPAPASGRGRHPFARGACFHGNGAGELHRSGRPVDSRLERLAIQLAVAYEQATGRLAGRGTLFEHFFALLLTFLFNTDDESDLGGRALRRAIRWHRMIGRGRRKRGRQPG